METFEEAKQVEESKLKNYEQSQFTNTYSTNYKLDNDFQKQIDRTITRRFELLCGLYLEYLKYWEVFSESSNVFNQSWQEKWGLQIEQQPEFQKMIEIWNNEVRRWYTSQTGFSEMVLNRATHYMRMTNMNTERFSKILRSNVSWWIPSSQR